MLRWIVINVFMETAACFDVKRDHSYSPPSDAVDERGACKSFVVAGWTGWSWWSHRCDGGHP
jgi:hypothetical protein